MRRGARSQTNPTPTTPMNPDALTSLFRAGPQHLLPIDPQTLSQETSNSPADLYEPGNYQHLFTVKPDMGLCFGFFGLCFKNSGLEYILNNVLLIHQFFNFLFYAGYAR